MDLKLSLKKESVREINDSFLSPKKFFLKETPENKKTSIFDAFKELLRSQDNEGRLVCIAMIVLGVILVLFQAFK